jgi:hypothetical protein
VAHYIPNLVNWGVTMSIQQRRSERLTLDVPLVIRGEAADRKKFQEERFTLIVNAHGALLSLRDEGLIRTKAPTAEPDELA